jgi:hypothetical protein
MFVRSLKRIVLLAGVFGLFCPLVSHAAPGQTKSYTDEAALFVLRYVKALAHSQTDVWAMADLSCLSRARASSRGGSPKLTPDIARRCWEDTLRSHTAMVGQQAESGVFSAMGRGTGLGLLHDRHRATKNWKEYPPAVFVSPPVILKDHALIPQIAVSGISRVQRFALSNIKGGSLVSVPGHAVDIKIVYSDWISCRTGHI